MSNETITTLFLLLIGMGFILLFFGGGGCYLEIANRYALDAIVPFFMIPVIHRNPVWSARRR